MAVLRGGKEKRERVRKERGSGRDRLAQAHATFVSVHPAYLLAVRSFFGVAFSGLTEEMTLRASRSVFSAQASRLGWKTTSDVSRTFPNVLGNWCIKRCPISETKGKLVVVYPTHKQTIRTGRLLSLCNRVTPIPRSAGRV